LTEYCNAKFSTLSAENFHLLMRKGVFTYEYIDCVQNLEKMYLPPRESFYSLLIGDTVSDYDGIRRRRGSDSLFKHSANTAIFILKNRCFVVGWHFWKFSR